MSDTTFFVFVLFLIGCGFFTSQIAGQKNYDKVTWFIYGFLFNVVALIAIGFYQKKV